MNPIEVCVTPTKISATSLAPKVVSCAFTGTTDAAQPKVSKLRYRSINKSGLLVGDLFNKKLNYLLTRVGMSDVALAKRHPSKKTKTPNPAGLFATDSEVFAAGTEPTPELRREAARLTLTSGRSRRQIAKKLRIELLTLTRWLSR